jgi:predicted transcriptional regulator of viral defense system
MNVAVRDNGLGTPYNRRVVVATLSDLGSSQAGYFLASQAAAAGIDRFKLQRLERQGLLERDSRGLYRLASYPVTDDSELWRAVLWPGLRDNMIQAVLSDDTALSLYEVSTISPVGVDITVSKGVRIRRGKPRAYRVRYRDYKATDITKIRGLPTTTLARSLLDLIVDARATQFVDEALELGPQRGFLTTREATTLRALRTGDRGLLEALRT